MQIINAPILWCCLLVLLQGPKKQLFVHSFIRSIIIDLGVGLHARHQEYSSEQTNNVTMKETEIGRYKTSWYVPLWVSVGCYRKPQKEYEL